MNTKTVTITPKEKEVLLYLSAGFSPKEIAVFFDLSHKTIEAHKLSLMRKLDLHSTGHIMAFGYTYFKDEVYTKIRPLHRQYIVSVQDGRACTP